MSVGAAVGGVKRERGARRERATPGMCDLSSFSFKGLLLALLKVRDPVILRL